MAREYSCTPSAPETGDYCPEAESAPEFFIFFEPATPLPRNASMFLFELDDGRRFSAKTMELPRASNLTASGSILAGFWLPVLLTNYF